MTGPRRTVDETAWWFAKAEATFAFLLRDFDAVIVERYFHFKGNYIDYQGPGFRFDVECAPDWNSLFGSLAIWRPDGTLYVAGDIDELLIEIAPETDWRFLADSGPVDRVAVAEAMDLWAAGLRVHLPTMTAAARGG